MTRFLSLVLLLLIPTTAFANVRAPMELDGDIVLTRLGNEAAQHITLSHEKLEIATPYLEEKGHSEYLAAIKATYTFENSSTSAVSMPLVFLATDVQNATVTVNGARVAGPTTAPMNDGQRAELVDAVNRTTAPDLNESRRSAPVDERVRDSIAAAFDVTLKPGSNEVTFSYRQHAFFNERSTRYGGVSHERSLLRVDYLLYPCKAWTLADSFRLDVLVTVPDYVNPGWFWDTRWEPQVTSTLDLEPTYDKKARTTTYAGSFGGFDVDVLTVRVERGPKR